MSAELLSQIDRLEKACHAALRASDDAQTIALLAQTLGAVKFTISPGDRALVRGLANLESTHSRMLLDALNTGAPKAVVHNGLMRVCNSLAELREALQDEGAPAHQTAS